MKTQKCNTCLEILELDHFLKNNKYIGKCLLCREKYKTRYESTKNKGKCYTCGNDSGDSRNCHICKEKYKIKARENREKARKNNMCTSCYKRKSENNCTSCRICLDSRSKISVVTKLFSQAKFRAKKYNKEFNIDKSDIILPKFCPILNIELQENDDFCRDNSYSLDRIDNSKGYIKGNIQIISHKANQIKSNSTIKELELLLNYLKSITP